jgi:hypothetical protein
VLAEHLDDDSAADAGESPDRPIRPVGNPREEFLNALAAVKKDVDEVIADFHMEPPTPNAAIHLSRKLRALYDTIERREEKESASIRADLEVLRDYAMGGSIAIQRLTGDDRPIDTMTDAFERVKKFKDKLQAVLNYYNSEKG